MRTEGIDRDGGDVELIVYMYHRLQGTRGSHEADSTIVAHQCNQFSPIVLMSLMRAPYKRKRKTKKNASLREDDDAAVDTVTHVEVEVDTTHRPKTKRIKVPLTAVVEEHGSGIYDNPDLTPEWDMQEPQAADEPIRPRVGKVSF